jgi:hypothetical protein
MNIRKAIREAIDEDNYDYEAQINSLEHVFSVVISRLEWMKNNGKRNEAIELAKKVAHILDESEDDSRTKVQY